MEVTECTIEYFGGLGNYDNCFNSPQFIKQVAANTDSVRILLFKSSKKVKLVLVVGIDDGIGKSPFSAPFGGFIPFSNNISMLEIDEAITLLINWTRTNGLKKLLITSPPDFYNQSFNSKIHNSLIRNAFNFTCCELNFHLRIDDFQSQQFEKEILWRNARKNLQIALNSDLDFVKVNDDQRAVAYDVILKNRTEKGYELKLSFAELLLTANTTGIDFFLVNKDSVPVAAAIVYEVRSNIVQVVYWGGLSIYQEYKPINFLAYKLIAFYSDKGVDFIDIGPSSINSIPDYGLCDFKESIGCNVSNKNTYTYVK